MPAWVSSPTCHGAELADAVLDDETREMINEVDQSQAEVAEMLKCAAAGSGNRPRGAVWGAWACACCTDAESANPGPSTPSLPGRTRTKPRSLGA
jgi:hypothetical protein